MNVKCYKTLQRHVVTEAVEEDGMDLEPPFPEPNDESDQNNTEAKHRIKSKWTRIHFLYPKIWTCRIEKLTVSKIVNLDDESSEDDLVRSKEELPQRAVAQDMTNFPDARYR